MKRMLQSIVRSFGYDIVSFNTYQGLPEPIIPWESETDFLDLYEVVRDYTLLDRRRLYMLYSAVKVSNILEGDLAEVGVFKGGTALLISKLSDGKKDVHLFDTFKGMPNTADSKVDIHVSGDFNDTSLAQVKQLLSNSSTAFLYPGFFPETAQDLKNKVFSFVHVDVDIYSSVLDCCNFFYPRLVLGGIILFDDYGFNSCPGVKQALQDFCSAQSLKELYLPTGQAMLWKR